MGAATTPADETATGTSATEGDTSDAALVHATLHGEPDAFGRLYLRHVAAVSKMVAFQVRDQAATEDITQDVFIKALKALPTLREPAHFRAWTMRIAHNHIANHWRAGSRQSNALSLDAQLEPDATTEWMGQHGVDDPELGRAEARVSASAVFAAARDLSALQRQVLALRFAAGLSLAEAAQVMQRSPDAVKQLQYRALEALRDQLAPDNTSVVAGQEHP